VGLCRELGIHYLWVDALCILQEHGSAEWNKEASNIDKIYGFATFTLAISSSADADDGFTQNKSVQAQEKTTLKATMAHHMIQLAPKTLQESKKTCPLDLRGWAFQEERLSPRIVHWTAHGVFWTCLSGSCSEFEPSFIPNKPGVTSPYFEDFARPYYQDWGEGGQRNVPIDRIWSQLIEAYSTRLFTRFDDRLPALSGLARKFANEAGDRYIAGHWLKSLHSDLLWMIAHGPRRDESGVPVTRLEIAPSWSWVTVPPAAGVMFPRRYGRPTYELIGYDVQRKSEEEFGAIRSASLTLKARLRPLLKGETQIEWPENEYEDEFNTSIFPEVKNVIYALDVRTGRILLSYNAAHPVVIQTDYGIPAALEQCYCLEINKNGFLVIQRLPESDQYLRIGCAQWHEDRHFFDGSDAVVAKLI
jgi:hypothetical protein